jgi:uncharacterized protein
MNRPSLRVFAACACTAFVFAISCGDSFVYYPDRNVSATPATIGLPFEALSIRVADNVTIAGWWVPSENARATLIFCHGNAGNISHRLDQLGLFHGIGLNVLLFDYRGYGGSEGSPSEEGTRLDADATWTYCTQIRGVAPGKIVIYGHSLGGAVAVRLAAEREAGCLIVDSSFTSVADVAARHVPGILARGLYGRMYDSRETIACVRCPVLVMHSPSDEVIPYEMGEELYARAREPKRFFRMRGSHNHAFSETGAAWTDSILDFIGESLKPKASMTGFLTRGGGCDARDTGYHRL